MDKCNENETTILGEVIEIALSIAALLSILIIFVILTFINTVISIYHFVTNLIPYLAWGIFAFIMLIGFYFMLAPLIGYLKSHKKMPHPKTTPTSKKRSNHY